MSLDRYVAACVRLAEELAESMSEEDVELLRGQVAGTTCEQWRGVRRKYRSEIAAVVSMTPSVRRRYPPMKDPDTRRLATLAGIQFCREAALLLEEVDKYGLIPGGPYRAMAARAGVAYSRIVHKSFESWPFDGDSPFVLDDGS